MRVISLSTQGIKCGIGDYNSDLKAAFERQACVYDVHPIDRSMSPTRRNLTFLEAFPPQTRGYDLAIVQHEFSFYGRSLRKSNRNFARLVRQLGKAGQPTLIFMHTIPPVVRKPSWLSNWKDRRAWRSVAAAVNREPNIRLIVHGAHSKDAFIEEGVAPAKIMDIVFPMFSGLPYVPPRPLTAEVTLLMFGFIAAYKGYETALNAMRLLPENVRLVIAGDRNPHGPNDLTLDAIHGFIETGQWFHSAKLPALPRRMTKAESESLRARVKFLGHITDLDEVIGNADIVLAPYTLDGPAGSSALSRLLSYGRPIIASGIPAFQDIQKRSNCMKLIPPYARFELAQAVRDLIADLPERQRMSAAAIKFVRENDFDSLAARIAALT